MSQKMKKPGDWRSRSIAENMELGNAIRREIELSRAPGRSSWSALSDPAFTKSVAFKITAETHLLLRRTALDRGQTLSALLEEIIETWFKEQGAKP